MAYVLRWINLILIFVFFVLALVSTCPLALFSYKFNGRYDQSGSISATLWEIQTGQVDVSTAQGQDYTAEKQPGVRINFLNCTEERSRFRAMQAFSIAGTVFGFYAFLICFVMCACRLKVKLPLFVFLLLAFISEFMLVIIGAVVYTTPACKNKENAFPAFKESGYSIGIAYVLQIIACVGYLITFCLTPCTQELWCGSC